jgi:pre-mRNA-processing factor SLU7
MLQRAAQRMEAHNEQENAAQAAEDSILSKKRLGEGDLNLDKDKLAQALNAEKKRKAVGEDDDDRWGGKRRKYGREGTNKDVTEEELGKYLPVTLDIGLLTQDVEAYRMSRRAGLEDPMFNYKD